MSPPILVLLLAGLLMTVHAADQLTSLPAPTKKADQIKFKHASFTFARVKYSGGGRGHDLAWKTDYPDSDINFTARVNQTTGLNVEKEGKVVGLNDAQLAHLPFIYMSEGGTLYLQEEEVGAL